MMGTQILERLRNIVINICETYDVTVVYIVNIIYYNI